MAEHQAGHLGLQTLNLVFPDVVVAKVGVVDSLCVIHDNREAPDGLLRFRGAD